MNHTPKHHRHAFSAHRTSRSQRRVTPSPQDQSGVRAVPPGARVSSESCDDVEMGNVREGDGEECGLVVGVLEDGVLDWSGG